MGESGGEDGGADRKCLWRGLWEGGRRGADGCVQELVLVKQADYYVLREGFNLVKMLSSPMILIAIVSLVSIVFLPKLMDKSMNPPYLKMVNGWC